ncbi:30S ribosomal protein S13 [Methanocella sp. MCL-LM]|uniref:30S ribosomal protein S13 n=1 Tax=Methanocella sp. MCL-LM TaxID=3412035 RepID=UPI003C72F9D8
MSEKTDKTEKKQKKAEETVETASAEAAPAKKGGKKQAAKPTEGAPADEAAKKGGKGKKPAAEEKPKDEIKYIVRIANTDLDGTQTVEFALTGIKGVGNRISKIVARQAQVDPHATMGYLAPEQVDKLRAVIDNLEANVPVWMLNRRRDIYTGEDKHLFGVDLTLGVKEDINIMKKIRSYKGIRHERGQKVRGQRTKSTGRTGATVGVVRKKGEQGGAAKKEDKK